MPRDPKDKNPLINFSHLPGAGDDAAAVDDSLYSIVINIFLKQKF